METILLEFGLKDGIFVGLFIWLLIYVLNTSKDRENRLLTFLDDMKGEFAKLVASYEKLSNDVAEIREDINQVKSNEKGDSKQ